MKNLKTELLVNLVVMLLIGVLAFCAGYAVRQGEVLQNAKEVINQDKFAYDIDDIQKIIYP